MKPRTLIVRSVAFYWRTHFGVLLGTALAAVVLIGSLLVGDSVKATLRRQAELRVGHADMAITGGDRFFRAPRADPGGGSAAPLLMLRATVARADGGARVNAAQLLGVEPRFWKQSPSGRVVELPADGLALNERLARQLGIVAGDPVIVRVEKPGAFSRDAPLSGEEADLVAIRANVARIVSDQDFGRFALTASQVPPFSVFAPLATLQEKLGLAGKANASIADAHTERATPYAANSGEAVAALNWKLEFHAAFLENAELSLLDLPNNHGLELRSPRVFLDDAIVEAAPRGKDGRRTDVLTYFVNAVAAGDGREVGRATPYSMVTALDTASSGFLPAELADDEIVVTEWLAEDLRVKEGDKITLKYFTMGDRRELSEQMRTFTILAVLPQNDLQLDGSWMPDFPGLKDAQNCRDWKPGFAIDMSKMRQKDNEYWEQFRGTPKAFVNLKAGQEMWGNRWGKVTALRWPAGTDRTTIETELRAKLTPEKLGFQFIPLREQALAATDAPVDFGQLFVSFSFFLILAAAVLTGLLFVFTLEQRNAEAGTLLALGLPPRLVRRMLLTEGAVLAVIGTLIGSVGALVYTKLVLRALGGVWRGAVGTSEFVFAAKPASLVGGVIGSVLIAVLAMWWASRRQLRRTATSLLSGEQPEAAPQSEPAARLRYLGWAFVLLAILLAAFGGRAPGVFFGAGALLLTAGLMLGWHWLRREGTHFKSAGDLAQRNAARRRGRSLATIAVLASGVFMVVAVDSFRQRPQEESQRRDSGTGGFALVGESASPIYEDLNSAKGRETYALDDALMKDVSVVPLRVRDGDDASCLNLNRALQPRLLAVKAAELTQRFRFGKKAADWEVLGQRESDGAIPGIVDANTLQWAMQKKIGDTIEYRDERGQPFAVRVAATLTGSMLQGTVLIDERHFIERFPSAGGYRFFLIDCPTGKGAVVSEELSRALQDRGLEMTLATRRLAEFQAVENTYLSIFQALGGLGLLLGSAGLAIVVARNVLERRREFGLLEALGFRAEQLHRLVFAEHRWLIVLGLVIGAGSALVAVVPQLAGKAGGFPWRELAILVGALAVGCTFWAWLATRLALRGTQLPALRSE